MQASMIDSVTCSAMVRYHTVSLATCTPSEANAANYINTNNRPMEFYSILCSNCKHTIYMTDAFYSQKLKLLNIDNIMYTYLCHRWNTPFQWAVDGRSHWGFPAGGHRDHTEPLSAVKRICGERAGGERGVSLPCVRTVGVTRLAKLSYNFRPSILCSLYTIYFIQ